MIYSHYMHVNDEIKLLTNWGLIKGVRNTIGIGYCITIIKGQYS